MPGYIFTGEPMNGTADRDIIIDVPGGSGPNSTINGNDGDDLILGDGDHFDFSLAGATNTSLATAMNIDFDGLWSTSSNPITEAAGPHTSLYIEPAAGQQRYFAVTVGANETLTADIDFTDNTSWSGDTDAYVEILDGAGNVVASNDDNGSDFGSIGNFDSRASYTPTVAGTYYIRVGEYGTGDGHTFEGGELLFLNVSVTNHLASAPGIVAGNDTISGGLGNDTIFGMLGTDIVHGDDGNDIIVSTGFGSYFGDGGNDTIYGRSGYPETLDGGTGTDMLDLTSATFNYTVDLATGLTNYATESFVNFENLRSGSGSDTLNGTIGGNTISGGAGDDTINGLAGDDTLSGDIGNDTVNGGDGNDYLSADPNGVDVLNGGNNDDIAIVYMVNGAAAHGDAGIDTLYLYTPVAGAVTINLNGNSTQGANTVVTDGFENLYYYYNYDATVTGTSGDNTIFTSGGNDTINAINGNDTISTGAGNDTVTGLNYGSYNGGDGIDTIDYSASGGGYTYYAYLSAGISTVGFAGPYFATYANIENYVGFADSIDYVRGTNGVNVISGLAEDDVLYGRGGDDTLNGGNDDDRLDGGTGNDVLNGGNGNDVLIGGGGDDGMVGGLGDDIYYVRQAGDSVVEAGSAGADVVRSNIDYVLGANVEELFIGGAADIGTGNGLDNTLHGSGSNNVLSGLGGNDIIRGGGGRDTIDGGTGEDLIDGGVGKDTMTGGGARDVFQFRDGDFGTTRALADVITDFSHANAEKINLNLVDANTIAGGNQAFTFIGNGAFTNVAGQLHYVQQGGNTYVEGDTNGNGTADFVINLTGTLNLVASDFVL